MPISMISYDYIYIDEENVRVAILDARGDSLTIKTNFPALGVRRIIDFTVTGSQSLNIQFRYSKDSVVWSEWNQLNIFNIRAINDLKYNHPFQIEYKVENVDNDVSWIKSISLNVDYKEMADPTTYIDQPMYQYFPFKNKLSLQYAANLLNKTFKSGIVPKYIKRKLNKDWEDEDYLDYWWNVIYINALKYHYSTIFKEILYRPELLAEFLKQRNLFVRKNLDLGELYYLASYYYNEMRRRGTILIGEDNYELPSHFHNISVEGELLRLLNVRDKRDIEFGVVSGDDLGWFIGKTCPGINDTVLTNQFIKGYETTKDINIISAYPLSNVTSVDVKYDHSVRAHVMTLKGLNTGIKFDNNINKLINVNPNFSYEITCLIKIPQGVKIKFGVNCYDREYRDLGRSVYANNHNMESYYFVDNENFDTERFVLLRGLIYDYNEEVQQHSPSKVGVEKRQYLKFKNDLVKYICPILIISETDFENKEVRITDFKIRPASIALADYISQENMVLLRVDKDLTFTEELNINKYLIPYNSDLKLQTKDDE